MSTLMGDLREMCRGLGHLIYPRTCAVCHEGLTQGEEVICTSCLYDLPRTRTWKHADNPVAKLLWGRVPVEQACAYFYFAKGSRYQRLLHMLKYYGRRDVGVFLGQRFGQELRNSALYADVEAVVPVPLHPRKQHQRGYNQSQAIAEGLAQRTGWRVVADVLHRHRFTQTQTKKNREERLENVANAFGVGKAEHLAGRHVLLVDDVITTGATTEHCVQALVDACHGIRVSVAALAFASGS